MGPSATGGGSDARLVDAFFGLSKDDVADGGFSGRIARGTRTSEIEAEIRREIQNERERYLGERGDEREIYIYIY